MLEKIRQDIITANWGTDLPSTMPTSVTLAWNGGLKASIPSALQREDKIICPLPRGGTGYAYLLHPIAKMNGKLAIHLPGHGMHWYSGAYGADTMTLALLGAGYHVLCVPMPGVSSFSASLVLDTLSGGTLTFPLSSAYGNHVAAEFNAAEADGIKPLPLFLDAAIIALNYAVDLLSPSTVDMTGLSGGGWTADWLSALDPRIRKTIPVFGSLPFSLRPPGDVGDWEQSSARSWWGPFSRSGGALTAEILYAMGATGGRRRVQILGEDDPIFPAATIHSQIETYAGTVRDLSGSDSEVLIDTTNDHQHKFTEWAVAKVLEEFGE